LSATTSSKGDVSFEEVVEKVLNEKPQIAGLAVPGMPVGSLGMGDDHKASYEVYSLTKPDMKPSVYMRMGG